LAFEEEGEPEGEGGAMWWAESGSWTLEVLDWVAAREKEGEGACVVGLAGWELTERRLRLSRRWRGTTVTISISQRKATSIGVRPACSGNAMVAGGVSCLVVEVGRGLFLGDALRSLMPQVSRPIVSTWNFTG
jgi:hypothetical protein